MPPLPCLQSERLTLDAFTPGDAADLMAIAGERRIADTTISVAHPFTAADAAAWIARSERAQGECNDAIRLRPSGVLAGYAGLHDIDPEHSQAEISFWVGAAHEGRGYVTEAAGRLVEFAFEGLGLNRLCAFHMVRNPGSARVLAKLGFQEEGLLRQRVRKWGRFEDVRCWGLLRAG